MSLAPVVGAALGVTLGGVLLALAALSAPPLLAGAAVVASGALLTRGMHLDGLADTTDALGSYRPAPAALAIMRTGDVGPFGVAALVLVLLAQAAALAALVEPLTGRLAGHGDQALAVCATVATATAAGRLSATWACRRGVPSARPEGLGALVAGTVSPAALTLGTATVVAVSVAAVPGRPWQGPLGVAGALAVAVALRRHVVRRLGGVTGDVLGASIEATTTLAYLALSLR